MITLTIIGVIAAMTVPNLMSNFRKREIETALPVAYKIIDDAMKLAIIENDSFDTWTYDGSQEFAEKYFIPYVKVAKICGTGFNPTTVGCFNPNISGFWYEMDNTPCTRGDLTGGLRYYRIILANGMHFAIWGSEESFKTHPMDTDIWFVVDINGAKGPTKVGVDVFAFHLNRRTGSVLPGHREKPKDDQNACNLKAHGYDCTMLIQQNSWKIPEDYPVKKF